MTYEVLTILLGLGTFLAYKLAPEKLIGPKKLEEITPNSENNPAKSKNKEETPETLAQWVLGLEKKKTELKEKLCLMPVFSNSNILFGRDELIIELFNAINKGRSFIELHGGPGVGKTALSLEVIKRHKYNYKNLKLYLDLGGEGDDALSSKDAMIQVVLSFRPTVRIPGNMTQLKKLYQNMMAKRQGFLILDNVASAQQIKDLKPSTSGFWIVIFTTGKKTNLNDVHSIHVEPLDVESAQELLIDCSLRLKPRAREIAKLCRGIPLALHMCGKFLSAKMKVHPEDFVNLFRKHRNNSLLERNDEYEESLLAAFKAIYISLSEKERMVFNQLAIFPSSFDAKASAQICEDNANCINSLSKFGLVKINTITKRYSLHGWIRSQLKNYLSETVGREARLRHANYYLTTLNWAHENILKGGEKACEGFQIFHREWANIQASLNRMRKNSVEGKKAAGIFDSYIVSGAELLPLRYFPKECLSFLDNGLKVSQRLGANNREAIHLLNLGVFHNAQKKYVSAEECLNQADQLSSTDIQTKGKIINELARLYLSQDKINEAIDILLRKKQLCREHKLEVDEEVSLMRLGLAYEKKGDFDKAVQIMMEGKGKAKEVGNVSCMGTLLKHLGYCLGKLKKLSSAENYFEASLIVAHGLGNKKDAMEILLRFAEICSESKDFEHALKQIEEGLEFAEKSRDKRYEGLFLVQKGDTYTCMHEKQKAVESYTKALEPLKKAKELVLAEETSQKLKRSFEMAEKKDESLESERVIKPIRKLSQGKGLVLVQSKTDEFIQRGDNKQISYYIGSIEGIIKTYSLDITETTTRKSLLERMGALRENNYHACATILKNKFCL